jgi:ABC-2 type transport system permease protein
VTSSATHSTALAGTGTLVRLWLRRDRVKLPVWAGGLGLFVVYLAAAIPAVYASEEELGGAATVFGDPVGRLVTGPGYGFDDPTHERFIASGYGLYLLVVAALMSILLVVRHTRAEEQTGRAELVRANVVGHHSPLTAALVVAAVTNLAAGLAVFGAMVAVGGFAVEGSLLLSTGIVAIGLAFAGLAALTVQLTDYSRAAAGMAGAVLGAAFALRAGGDASREGGSALSWESPLAWAQQAAPFVLDRWWPLVLPLVFAVVTAAGGYALSTRRDVGASLTTVRQGRPRASSLLGTSWGLELRLQRASLTAWTTALAVAGLTFGAFADAMLQAFDDLPDAFTELFGPDDLLAGYLAYMAGFMAYLVAAYAVLAVQGQRGEETSGRAEPVLATAVSRRAWLGSNLVVTTAAAVLMLTVTGVATGTGAAIVTGEVAHIGQLTVAHLNQLPAVLVVLGMAAALFGVTPRAVPVTWVLLGYAVIAGTFGPLLDLPTAATSLSPFEHPARLPQEVFAPVPVVTLTAVAFGTAAVALLGFRRRDLTGA